MVVPVGVALSQVVSLEKARTLLKQRRRLRLAASLMMLSIVPVPVAIVIYILM
jgi:hypothetical protein